MDPQTAILSSATQPSSFSVNTALEQVAFFKTIISEEELAVLRTRETNVSSFYNFYCFSRHTKIEIVVTQDFKREMQQSIVSIS